MKQKQDEHSVCQGCGASVYREHLDSGIARYEEGRLLCSHCVAEFEAKRDRETTAEVFEPIAFDDDDSAPARSGGSAVKEATKEDVKEDLSKSRMAATAAKAGMGVAWDESRFRRPLQPLTAGATRCRLFHCRLSEGAMDHMIHEINDWMDENEDIVIKFVSSTIGPFEGKRVEPNLIMTVFY